jgi:hypothetical protein
MRRIILVVVSLLVFAVPAAAGQPFPGSVPLPDGFYPEGIAVGTGHTFYAGSLLDGAVYAGDLRTGEGEVIAAGVENRIVAGLAFDQRSGLLWGVGSDEGDGRAFVFDATSGELIDEISIDGGFLNDVVVTREAAYITDSFADVFWTVPLDARGLPVGPAQPITLTGDFELVTTGELPINLNGIDATPNGKTLIAVHSTLGVLYRIDPASGEATEIDLGGDGVPSGDGIVLQGRTLYVVQNFLNRVAVVTLEPDLSAGGITEVLTSDLFRVPTTAAVFGDDLYLVNARFDVAFPPAFGGELMSVDYDVVSVPR